MIKRLSFFLFCLLTIVGQSTAQYKDFGYSAYISMGGYMPANYAKNPDGLTFINLALETESNPGFELGGTIYYKRIGLNLGFGFYKYEFDAAKYQTERQNFYQNKNVSTFISAKLKDIPIFTGVSYYFKIHNFYIEPGFLVRLNKVVAPYNADTYFWNSSNLLRTIDYYGKSTYRLDYVPEMSLAYFYPILKGYRVGFQVSYQYSFSNPNYKFEKTEIDLENNTIVKENQNYTTKYSSSKISIGIVFRFN
jgi:hypothetical protein